MLSNDSLAKSHEVFEQEMACYRDQLYPAALRLTFNSHDAEDLVQETLLRAYLGANGFTPGTNLRAWMYAILRNTFINAYRKRMREPWQQPAGHMISPERGLGTGTTTRSAEAEALDRLGESDILHVLAELPQRFRAAMYLVDVEGYRYRDIAEILQMPVGTVSSRLHRARQMLRRRLAGTRSTPSQPAT